MRAPTPPRANRHSVVDRRGHRRGHSSKWIELNQQLVDLQSKVSELEQLVLAIGDAAREAIEDETDGSEI